MGATSLYARTPLPRPDSTQCARWRLPLRNHRARDVLFKFLPCMRGFKSDSCVSVAIWSTSCELARQKSCSLSCVRKSNRPRSQERIHRKLQQIGSSRETLIDHAHLTKEDSVSRPAGDVELHCGSRRWLERRSKLSRADRGAGHAPVKAHTLGGTHSGDGICDREATGVGRCPYRHFRSDAPVPALQTPWPRTVTRAVTRSRGD